MITAIDTSVLLDIFLPDKAHVERSASLLRYAYDEGALAISHLVYAELVPQFDERATLEHALAKLNIQTLGLDDEIAYLAGQKWKEYRAVGGTRERILSDFIIGAHAMLRADRFLTRDRGFYRTYYPTLNYLGSPAG